MNTIRFYNILKTAGLSVAALIMASISSRQLPVYVMRGGGDHYGGRVEYSGHSGISDRVLLGI